MVRTATRPPREDRGLAQGLGLGACEGGNIWEVGNEAGGPEGTAARTCLSVAVRRTLLSARYPAWARCMGMAQSRTHTRYLRTDDCLACQADPHMKKSHLPPASFRPAGLLQT